MLNCSASSSFLILIRVITPRRDVERMQKTVVKCHDEDGQAASQERERRYFLRLRGATRPARCAHSLSGNTKKMPDFGKRGFSGCLSFSPDDR